MRHRNKGRRLNMPTDRRNALFRSLAIALIDKEIIKTTVPRAKEMRRYLERLITKAKLDNVANRRLLFGRLRDDAAIKKLFVKLAPRYVSRPGGYTRVLRCGFRSGDNAPMAYIELVDRAEVSTEQQG